MSASIGGEHRACPRRAMAIDATLNYKDLSMLDCKTRNISCSGAFVDTPAAPPPENAEVRLTLNRDDDESLTVDAQVIYHTDEGAALRFVNLDPMTYSTLVHMIFSWHDSRTAGASPPKPLPDAYKPWK